MVKLKLTATLKDYYGNALSGKPIDFYYSYDGETYLKITTQTTDVDGKAETIHETTQTTWYKARFEGDEVYDASEVVERYYIPTIIEEMISTFIPFMIQWLLILLMLILLRTLTRSLRRKD